MEQKPFHRILLALREYNTEGHYRQDTEPASQRGRGRALEKAEKSIIYEFPGLRPLLIND